MPNDEGKNKSQHSLLENKKEQLFVRQNINGVCAAASDKLYTEPVNLGTQ